MALRSRDPDLHSYRDAEIPPQASGDLAVFPAVPAIGHAARGGDVHDVDDGGRWPEGLRRVLNHFVEGRHGDAPGSVRKDPEAGSMPGAQEEEPAISRAPSPCRSTGT